MTTVTLTGSDLRRFLHGLPGVDRVGAEARAAGLATRSIKTTAKQWALDLAISMVDLTTLEGAGHAGQGAGAVREGEAPGPGRPDRAARSRRSASTPTWSHVAAAELQGTGIHVASVATAFPSGQAPPGGQARRRRGTPIAAGADEVDMVIDRGAFLAGDYRLVFDEIVAVKRRLR